MDQTETTYLLADVAEVTGIPIGSLKRYAYHQDDTPLSVEVTDTRVGERRFSQAQVDEFVAWHKERRPREDELTSKAAAQYLGIAYGTLIKYQASDRYPLEGRLANKRRRVYSIDELDNFRQWLADNPDVTKPGNR